jgi:hypothetical protein
MAMKKKIGTVMDEGVLNEAKHRAVREGRPLAKVIEDALTNYLRTDVGRDDALRACEKFCSSGGALDLREIDRILEEDALA